MKDLHIDFVRDDDFEEFFHNLARDLLSIYFKEKPIGFVDIGARGSVCPYFDCISSVLDVLAIEPCEASIEQLKNLDQGLYYDVTYDNSVVWKHIGHINFHHCNVSTNNSIYPVNEALLEKYHLQKFAQSETIQRDCTTLDDIVLNKYKYKPFGEIIKIDTQGSEYEILAGAAELLSQRTVGIISEVSFLEIYQGQRLFSDVESLLRKFDFQFFGFLNTSHRSSGTINYQDQYTKERIFQADAIFIKKEFGNRQDRRNSIIMYMFSIICGYFDHAQTLLNSVSDLDENIKTSVDRMLQELASKLHSKFSTAQYI